MRHREIRGGIRLSELGLGGHEFLSDGRVKAMGEDFYRSVTPGVLWEGFGGDSRKELLAAGYQAGINFYDVTIDSEKEALGRNLEEMPPPYEVYVQTRPEGMVYNNDPGDTDKSKLLDYALLRAEAERACRLLRRSAIDFYNFGVFPPAVQRQPGYLSALAENVARLKEDGLVRFACVDTLSGQDNTLEMIATGVFDGVFTNLSVLCERPLQSVIPLARERDMVVIVREVFSKGALFEIGEAASIEDHARVAGAALRWVLSRKAATVVVLGAANSALLEANLHAVHEHGFSEEDDKLLEALRQQPLFRERHRQQDEFFLFGFR